MVGARLTPIPIFGLIFAVIAQKQTIDRNQWKRSFGEIPISKLPLADIEGNNTE